jgi:hypothetical protein
MEEELSKILWKLSHDIADIVKTLKENGKIRKVKRLWFRERITNFEYKEGNIRNVRFHLNTSKGRNGIGKIGFR